MLYGDIPPDRADALFALSDVSYIEVIFLLRTAEALFRSNREKSWMFDCRAAVIAVARALVLTDTLKLNFGSAWESYRIPYERLVTAILGFWRSFSSNCHRESVESLLLSADNNGLIIIDKRECATLAMSNVAVQPSGDREVLKEAKRLGITKQMVPANHEKPSDENEDNAPQEEPPHSTGENNTVGTETGKEKATPKGKREQQIQETQEKRDKIRNDIANWETDKPFPSRSYFCEKYGIRQQTAFDPSSSKGMELRKFYDSKREERKKDNRR